MCGHSVPMVMAAATLWSSFDGSRRAAASLVSHKPDIPSVPILLLPPPPQPNSAATPPSQTQPLLSSSSSVAPPPVQLAKSLRIQPTAELGLASLLFVLSAAFAALFSVAIMCIPTMSALRTLASAVGKLTNVVSREVPGTLLSLKLSVIEIDGWNKQLAALREKLSATRWGESLK